MGESPITAGGLTVRQLQDRVHQFNEGRGWPAQHSVRSLSEALVVESAELLELSLWGSHAEDRGAALRDEMADVGIYLVALANHLDLDLAEVILDKLTSNEQRFPNA